jgi:hypothetical protein
MSMSGASPSWDEARAFLREKFALAKDTEEIVALAWRISAQGQDFVQWVRVSPVSVHGESWLAVLADICPQTHLPATTALEYLNGLPFGALMLWNGVYFFRHTLALEWLVLPALEHTIRLVAHEAVRLRLAIVPPKPAEQALAHYDE